MIGPEHPTGERLASLENERRHTTTSLLNIQAQMDVRAARAEQFENKVDEQFAELREMVSRSKGFLAGLTAAGGIAGGVIATLFDYLLHAK
jgi:hypothetical protein